MTELEKRREQVRAEQRERKRLDALAMFRSGATFGMLVERHGFELAEWARAMAWEQDGAHRDDEGGWACWLRVFEGEAPAERFDVSG